MTTETAYEAVWPDGDIYASRHGEIRLTAGEARATAPAIGGTWRHATAPADGRLYFYKLTCGHEIAAQRTQATAASHDCREGGRPHRGAVTRLTRVRDIPAPAPARPDQQDDRSTR
jgi:hypothetical protein